MGPVEDLREFISSRLSAAAAEIFSRILPTIIQHQEEIQAQQRLLEMCQREPTKSPTADDPQQNFYQGEQFLDKQQISSLAKEELEPPQIKEGQEDPECLHNKARLPMVKQDTDTIMVIANNEQSEYGENLIPHNFVRDFIYGRLTAAAGEIFTMFHQTVVQYEEEILAQRRLLDISLNPQIKLNRIDGLEEPINSSLHQEQPGAPQIKDEEEEPEALPIKEEEEEPEVLQIKEEEEVCTNHGEEQLEFKQEVDTILIITPGEPSKSKIDDKLLLSQDSVDSESQNMGKIWHECSGSTSKAEWRLNRRCHSENMDDSLSLCTRNHSVEKPLLKDAETCGVSFGVVSALVAHRITHMSEKPFSCGKCDKVFKHPSGLLAHLRAHTGEKPFSCEICGKMFREKSSLVVHIRTHTGEKPYSCETCGRGFSILSSLVTHRRTHTGEKPYSCVTCGKSFRCRNALLPHLRIHTGEKPYSCDICLKNFRTLSALVVHKRCHTGKKHIPV